MEFEELSWLAETRYLKALANRLLKFEQDMCLSAALGRNEEEEQIHAAYLEALQAYVDAQQAYLKAAKTLIEFFPSQTAW